MEVAQPSPFALLTDSRRIYFPEAAERISAEEVRQELQRIVQSGDFPASDRNRRFLVNVVEKWLDGRSAEITAKSVAVEIFGRSDLFVSSVDPIVRIEAGKLRRDLETYYLKSGRRNPLRITIPRGGYIPVVDAAPQDGGSFPARAARPEDKDPRAELRRILHSRDFPASDRNRRFLEYIVECQLEGRSDEISALHIACRIFGRPKSFNPNKDPIVRIEAGKLRRDLETYYLKSGRHNPLRISIPLGGYRPAFAEVS
jgi:hypothetical protein